MHKTRESGAGVDKADREKAKDGGDEKTDRLRAVSYTHLTLPTTAEV